MRRSEEDGYKVNVIDGKKKVEEKKKKKRQKEATQQDNTTQIRVDSLFMWDYALLGVLSNAQSHAVGWVV